MTTPVSNIPVSIDYTSRDYYSLREALINRVKDRTGGRWSGEDPSDFGVALVESFAYMGDLINYYIDRVANESYLGTATQRQNVLNLASMIGYTAGGYTSATVNVTLTNSINVGYRGQIGASELTGGTARLVLPNDNEFDVGERINISGMSRTEYNGTFTITGNPEVNQIEYKPADYSVTATGNGSLVIYTTSVTHNFKVGQIVTVSGFTVGDTGYNLSNKTITAVTATTVTVAGALTGATTTTGGKMVYADIAVVEVNTGFVHDIGYVTVPAGTQLSAEIVSDNGTVLEIIFTTLSQAVIPYVNDDGSAGSQTVLARHGQDVSTLTENQASTLLVPDVNGELIGYSTGEADQMLVLIETEVDISTLSIYVENGNAFDEWTAVQHLEDQAPDDNVYKVVIDADYNIAIQFGDGLGGAVPTKDARIKAAYYRGAGLSGNIPAGAIDSIYDVPGATSVERTLIMSKVTASNSSPATGGDEPESLDSIRYNAPSALRALTRAVTLEDFANLSISIPRVAKANAVATLPTSVAVYIAPERSSLSLDVTPGIIVVDEVNTADSELISLKSEVSEFLSDKIQIGTTVTVLDPKYTFIEIGIEYTRFSNYDVTAVETAIKKKLVETYSYINSDFQTTLTPQTIETTIRQVPGVQTAYVTSLFRKGGSGKNTLAGTPDELFVLISDDIELTTASNVATLDSVDGLLVTASGSGLTLTPAFTPSVFAYVATTSNSTVDVEANASLGQSISIDNKDTGSGALRNVSLNTGVNTIPVSVTAADSVTTNTYVLTVVKT